MLVPLHCVTLVPIQSEIRLPADRHAFVRKSAGSASRVSTLSNEDRDDAWTTVAEKSRPYAYRCWCPRDRERSGSLRRGSSSYCTLHSERCDDRPGRLVALFFVRLRVSKRVAKHVLQSDAYTVILSTPSVSSRKL